MKTEQEPQNTIELIKLLKKNNIEEKDYQFYFSRFLESKARKINIPMTGNFELTPFCNLNCKMCYVHLLEAQFDSSNILSFLKWKSLIDQAHSAGMLNATLTGGECLIHPEFDKIYLYLHSIGITPGILSNGVLINKDKIDFFKQYRPKRIQITLYGSSDDAYEKVTGSRVFHTVCNNLIMMREAELPVKITITPSIYMEDDIRPLLETVQELKIPYDINANLIPPRKNTGRKVHDLSIDKYVEIFKIRNEFNNRKLIEVDPVDLPDESKKGIQKYGVLCGAGRSSFVIRYDGSMSPCQSLDEMIVYPLEEGFMSAWRKMNNLANNYPLPIECGDCVYFDRCLKCIAMHKNSNTPGHCDTRICERTKKLIVAGFVPLPLQHEEK